MVQDRLNFSLSQARLVKPVFAFQHIKDVFGREVCKWEFRYFLNINENIR